LGAAVAAGLSADPHYGAGVRVLRSRCIADEAIRSSDSDRTVLLSGKVSGDGKVVQPWFLFMIRGQEPISVFVERKTETKATTPLQEHTLARQYLDEAETFIVALRSPSFQQAIGWENLAGVNSRPADDFAEVVEAVLSNPPLPSRSEGGDAKTRTFVEAYRALGGPTPIPNDIAALSHYALGVGLLADKEDQLAIAHLSRSLSLSPVLPSKNDAQRFEALGLAYAEVGEFDRAMKSLTDALRAYSKANLTSQVTRVRRTIESILAPGKLPGQGG
jgi:tetratricopeptide (TPR) repeat protein